MVQGGVVEVRAANRGVVGGGGKTVDAYAVLWIFLAERDAAIARRYKDREAFAGAFLHQVFPARQKCEAVSRFGAAITDTQRGGLGAVLHQVLERRFYTEAESTAAAGGLDDGCIGGNGT